MKPGNVYRIVVLGDSHVVSVKKEATFATILETLLNKDHAKGRKKVEVYNGGGLGWGPYQYYLELNDRVRQYRPDLVIVAFYIGNDFLDLYRNDDRPCLWFDGRDWVHKPPIFFKCDDPNDNGILRRSRVFCLLRWAFRASIGYQYSRAMVLWAVGRKNGKSIWAAARYVCTIARGYFINQHVFRQSMNQTLFLKTFPSERIVIDRVNRRTMELTKATADRNGIELLYVPIPTGLQVEPEKDPAAISKILALCGLDRRALKVEDELSESLFSLLDEHNIKYLRVKDALVARAKTHVLYDATYHINGESHRIIAEAIYQKVKPMLSESSPR